MSSDSSYVQAIIAAYPRLLVENYCILASSALLWFDFALTFTTEVHLIWGRKFSGATLAYLFMRYTALIDRALFVTEIFLWNSSDQTCGRIERTDGVLLTLNYFVFAAFMILRVYGVWGRDWKPLLLVIPLTLIKPILLIYENANYVPEQAGPQFGCYQNYTLSEPELVKFSTLAQAVTIAADAILIGLTWVKTFDIGKLTPLVTLLLLDGTANFIILLIQIAVVSGQEVESKSIVWFVWPYFNQVFTVILLSRFILDLRGLYYSDGQPYIPGAQPGAESAVSTSVRMMSDIRFTTSRIVGNLGATLSHADFTSSDGSARDIDSCGGGEIEEVKRDENKDEWYGDENPVYANDPFREGLLRQPAVVDIELVEPLRPPSPVSPMSHQDGS